MVCPGGHPLSFYARFGGKKSKKEYIRSCSCSLGMRHHISCSSCNFIYMIQCNKLNVTCNTSAKLNASSRDGFGEHRRSIEKARNPHHFYHPTVVSDRLLPSRSHSIKDIELIPLELINSDSDGIRKAREGFLIS